MHCYSPDKVGKDTGELAGMAPNGVTATGSIEEIIAAKPDVLTFHGVFPDEDLYVKVLEAGINIVTTADWITGWHRDTNHPHPSGKPVSQLLQEACEKGGATFYGTGMNPGLNQILGVVCSADVAEIENITTIESVDVSCHHSKDTWIEVGYGLPVDDPEIPAKLEKYTRVFADSVLMMADCFDLPLDEVKFSYELGACTKDVDLGWYTLPKGSLGGNYIKYQGIVDGVPRVETHLEWQMTPHTDPSWHIKGCYITQITGDPCVYNKHMIFPKPGVDLSDPANFASIGMTVTGHARAGRHRRRRRGASGTDDQRRPAAARVRRPLQALGAAHQRRPERNVHLPLAEFDSDVTFPASIVLNVSRATTGKSDAMHRGDRDSIERQCSTPAGNQQRRGVRASGNQLRSGRRRRARSSAPTSSPRPRCRHGCPRRSYKSIVATIDKGTKLDPAVADAVAVAMKDWALEKGATHYAHVFYPMTGLTAEKHDSFLDPGRRRDHARRVRRQDPHPG